MIKKVFIGTDVILDVAFARESFFPASKMILAMAEANMIIGTLSSNCVVNIYDILRKAGGDDNARRFISALAQYIPVIPIDHQNVLDALHSGFSDFEDALQNCSAAQNQCEYIITRNIGDYAHSGLKIASPEDFIRLYEG